MPLILPQSMVKSYGQDAANSIGTLLTGGGSTNTKGSYVSLLDPIPPGAQALHVYTFGSSSTRNCLDLAIGPTGGGSEADFLKNLLCSRRVNTSGYYIRLPIGIPPGKRLSARNQSSSASGTLNVGVTIEYGNKRDHQIAIAESIGVNVSGATAATDIDPGATPNTKGSYVQLVASTPVALKGFYLCQVIPEAVTGTPAYPSVITWLVDIAIGTTIIAPDLPCFAESSADYIISPSLGPFWVPIPAGSQLQARAQCSVSTANYRNIGLYLLGLR